MFFSTSVNGLDDIKKADIKSLNDYKIVEQESIIYIIDIESRQDTYK